MNDMTGSVKLSGHVYRVNYYNPSNGWRVIIVEPDENMMSDFGFQRIVVTGEFVELHVGDHVDIEGEWVDTKYGKQIKMTRQLFETIYTKEGLYRFLSSGHIYGIGDALATSIVEEFGETLPHVIENEPEKILKIKGINEDRLQSLVNAWNEKAGLRKLLVFLQNASISNGIAVKAYNLWGESAIERIQENPYIISQLSGVGFQTADVFALSLGLKRDSKERILAGVDYALDLAAKNGHTFLPLEELIKQMSDLLEVSANKIAPIVRDNKRSLTIVPVEDYQEAVFTKHNFNIEFFGANKMLELKNQPIMHVSAITDFEGLTDEQKQGLENAISNKISVITGGPGTGKSHCIKKIIDHLTYNGKRCRLAAPTGKAAKRLKETTGYEGMTLHRLLGLTPRDSDILIFEKSFEEPLDADFFVVDEYSMVDAWLNYKLFEKLPTKAHLLIVGDVDQLPSVGAGNVLRDIIDSGLFPVTRLTKIFRQNESSDIVVNAHKINNGQFIQIANDNGMYHFATNSGETAAKWICDEVFPRLNKKFGIKYEDIQVLVPMYKGHCGVNNLNEQLQNKFNPDMGQLSVQIAKQTFRIGDRVMQTKNDYFLNVYNGDTGYITKIEGETADSRLVTIKYDDREVVYDMDQLHNIVLAYAITIHKSQGCEYPGIIIALLPEHYIMLQRNLFYTAVTRAKTACVVVGDEKSMSIAIANDKINKRFTALKWFLKTVNLNDGYFEELIEEESLEKKLKEKELEMDEIPF